jgi:uncharacterized protein
MDQQAVIARTRRWVSAVVIGLNFCPFARRVFEADLIRYVVTDATDAQALFEKLTDELLSLAAGPSDRVETTLLIHPLALADYAAYNDFLGDGDRLIGQLGLTGRLQIAGFHPAYQFAGTEPGAVENYTNRSPYPMLHLLREESLTQVAGDPDGLAEIPRRNVATLKKLGRAGILDLIKELPADDTLRRSALG